MKELKEIKVKMQEFLNEFKSIDNPDDAILKFKNIFKDKYFEENISENSPYYKSQSQKLYLKNGYGLGLMRVSGPGDFLTLDNPSHHGIDLYIFSAVADEYITLFYESEKMEIDKNINDLYNLDFSTKKLLEIKDDLIFKCFPNDIRNNTEIINGRYANLKFNAEAQHEQDIQDDLISYYGGLDVTINSTEYYLYNSLLKYSNDKIFMQNAIPLFIKDFPEYFNNEINYYEHAIYIINHIDSYLKIADVCNSIEELKTGIEEMQYIISDYTKNKTDLQLKLDNVLEEYKKIEIKNYNVLELIIGKRKSDAIKKVDISSQIDCIKTELNTIQKSLDELDASCKSCENGIQNFTNEKNLLLSELERPFKDFTLNPDFETELYIDGSYYMNVSLNRLKNKKDYFTHKLQELQMMKSYDKSVALTNTNELNKQISDDINYDY